MKKSVIQVPVLTYHSIDESGSKISVSRAQLDRHIRYLKRTGYSSLSLRDAVRRVRERRELPQRAVVITFDDGYRNNLRDALPVLTAYGFTATVFVTTGYIGKTNRWPNQHSSIPKLPMMTWDEIKEMRRAGIDFGAHSHSHTRLTEVEPEEARREMLRSKSEIEERLGEAIDLLAYPYGSYNGEVKEIASSLFEAAIANRPGRLHAGGDLYALDRINTTGGLFKLLPIGLSGGSNFGVYLSIKGALDRLRSGTGDTRS